MKLASFESASLKSESPAASFWPRVSFGLGGMLLLFGLAMALTTAWIVHKTFSPILFFDQWVVVMDMMQAHGHLSLAQLWEQHNEHRIPWGKLAGLADLRLFGGRNISLLCEIYAIQAANALFLVWIFRRYGRSNASLTMSAAGLFLFAMFYPIQIENFYWGFQVAFVTMPFAASVSIGTAIVHADVVASREGSVWFAWPLAISLAAAVVAETSVASGCLVWPMLVVLSFILGMPRGSKYLIAGAGTICMTAFLWGYRSPSYHANPLESLRHPITVSNFLRAALAWSWDPATPNTSWYPTLAQLCALIAMVVVVVGFLRTAWLGPKANKLQLFLLANAVFLLITLLMIALGRINFGIGQAIASRYQTFALLFWACFGALLLVWRTENTSRSAGLVEIQIALLLLFLAGVPRIVFSAESAKVHQRAVAHAYKTLLQDPANTRARGAIAPFSNLVEMRDYLWANHWGPSPEEFRIVPGVLEPISSALNAQLKVNGYEVLSPDQCAGALDSVQHVPGEGDMVDVSGWAWTPAASSGRIVLLALDDGTVLGSGRISLPRPDVEETAPSVTEVNTGWAAEVSLPHGRILRAFVNSAHSTTVCPLLTQFKRQ